MANASYVMARALTNQGYDAVYIRDQYDTFPFSQPVWEDVEFLMPYDHVHKVWGYDEWLSLENKLGWTKPDWVVMPKAPSVKDSQNRTSLRRMVLGKILESIYISRVGHRSSVIAEMRKCDALYVCGVEAEVLAWASGIPYVIWPHGGDIRLASGLSPSKANSLRGKMSNFIMRFYLKTAFDDCLWIGTHDPKGVGGNQGVVPYALEHLPLPLLDRPPRLSKTERHKNLIEYMAQYGISIPSADYYVFIPSRIDFFWKGTDLLLDAISKIEKNDIQKIHFIFSGWGQNYNDVKKSAPNNICTFLPFSVSKPILFKLFMYVDIVVDQFLFGSYGAVAIEAMSCATPVMMSIDVDAFNNKKWEAPPVINVDSVEGIQMALEEILDGRVDLEKSGLEMLHWYNRNHAEKVVVSNFIDKLRKRIG
ncbi:glycosyltransferase [Micavibrio aeruginosavorus]|uniref:glycosyltransferase n=1 Tax=Micavibrio aeruginosavorus TaxID=349221 RepID=UPI003F4ACDE9